MNYRQALLDQGWFVVRGVLPPQDIAIALERLRQIAAHIEHYQHIYHIHPVAGAEQHPDPLHRFDWIDNITYLDEVLWRHVAAHPALLTIARAVVGPQVYALNGGGFFMKPPNSNKGVPWHQDASPFSAPPKAGRSTNAPLFDFWLGLSEATEAMGCLQLIPGSQHRGRLPHHEAGELHSLVDVYDLGYTDADIVSVTTEPGDLVVWHQDMVHGSQPNRSTKARIAVASIYHGQHEEEQIRDKKGNGIMPNRPQLCDGKRTLTPRSPITPPA